jgi:hypothetical protein
MRRFKPFKQFKPFKHLSEVCMSQVFLVDPIVFKRFERLERLERFERDERSKDKPFGISNGKSQISHHQFEI